MHLEKLAVGKKMEVEVPGKVVILPRARIHWLHECSVGNRGSARVGVLRGSGFCEGRGSWSLTPSLTLGFAGLGDWVHLVALVTLTLEVSLVVDAGLAAGCRVLTLIYVWGGRRES